MIGVHIHLVVAGGHIILVEIVIDFAGYGEPPQCVGPQIAQIGLRLAGGVVRAGQNRAAVSLQRVIQLHLVAVGIREFGCGYGSGHYTEQDPQGQHKADILVRFFHSFLPKVSRLDVFRKGGCNKKGTNTLLERTLIPS